MIKLAGIIRKQHSAENNNHQELDWEDSFTKKILDCICPKCSVRHKMDLLWAGRGSPRIF